MTLQRQGLFMPRY